MFTARYGLIPYIKQITFRLLKVKWYHIWEETIQLYCCKRLKKAYYLILMFSIQMTMWHMKIHINCSETWTIKARDAKRITAAQMKYMRRTTGYIWTDYKTNAQMAKELKITPILDKLLEYKRNWIQHVNRIPCNRLPRVMKRYSPTGRRNYGRPLKRLLDTWDWNGSTSGPTPWQMYDDDDDINCSPATFCLSDYTHKYPNESGQRCVYDEWNPSV